MRMHLRVHVPNEGAHRLAWWIGQQPDSAEAIEFLARKMGSGVMMIDRLLSGEVRPGLSQGMQIMAATEGAVLPRDWYRGATVGWFDRPAAREAYAEARLAA